MESITSICGGDRRYHSLRIISTLCTLPGVVLMLIGMLLLAFGVSALFPEATPTPPPLAEPLAVRQVSVLPLGVNARATISLLGSFTCLLAGIQSVRDRVR